VLPAHPQLNPKIHANSGWIGVRLSSHPLTQSLLKSFTGPITTTSANPSGELSGQKLDQLESYFPGDDWYFLNGGDLPPSKGSTVVKVEDNPSQPLHLLREGDISFSEIQSVLMGKK